MFAILTWNIPRFPQLLADITAADQRRFQQIAHCWNSASILLTIPNTQKVRLFSRWSSVNDKTPNKTFL